MRWCDPTTGQPLVQAEICTTRGAPFERGDETPCHEFGEAVSGQQNGAVTTKVRIAIGVDMVIRVCLFERGKYVVDFVFDGILRQSKPMEVKNRPEQLYLRSIINGSEDNFNYKTFRFSNTSELPNKSQANLSNLTFTNSSISSLWSIEVHISKWSEEDGAEHSPPGRVVGRAVPSPTAESRRPSSYIDTKHGYTCANKKQILPHGNHRRPGAQRIVKLVFFYRSEDELIKSGDIHKPSKMVWDSDPFASRNHQSLPSEQDVAGPKSTNNGMEAHVATATVYGRRSSGRLRGPFPNTALESAKVRQAKERVSTQQDLSRSPPIPTVPTTPQSSHESQTIEEIHQELEELKKRNDEEETVLKALETEQREIALERIKKERQRSQDLLVKRRRLEK